MGARDKLSDKAIKAAKPRAGEYKMSDGRGLYLVVPTKKAKWFRFDSRFAGKQLTLSVGRYGEKKSDTTLATFMTAIRDSERTRLMQHWADRIDEMRGSNIVSMTVA